MSDSHASISETNRMRAELGLAPLAVDGDRANEAAREQIRQQIANEREKENLESIRAELAARKAKRLQQAKLSGPSLGESLKSTTGSSAADWVARSRSIGMNEAKQAEQLRLENERKAKQQADYDETQLTGIKIQHDYDEFDQQQEMILTLKDSRILKGVADDIDDEEDTLENIELMERAKTTENNRLRKKKKSIYDQNDENEHTLLAHYDEPEQKEGIRIGAKGTFSVEQARQRKEREQLNDMIDNAGPDRILISLDSDYKVASDFKEVKFRKKKKKKK